MKLRIISTLTAAALALAGCGSSSSGTSSVPTSTTTTPVFASQDAALRAAMATHGVQTLRTPPQNPDKVALGKALMFDKLLSGNKDIACATCHHFLTHGGDDLALSIGTGGHGLGATRQLGQGRVFVSRSANDIVSKGLPGMDVMLWDGRVNGTPQTGFKTPAGNLLPPGLDSVLAAQALFPFLSREEMMGLPGDRAVDGTVNELGAQKDLDFIAVWGLIVQRVKNVAAYAPLFAKAYPDVPFQQIGIQHIANAIGAFEASAFDFTDTPFDRYVAGDDNALNPQQKRGAELFYGKARCAECHRGGLLSDMSFHNIAAPQIGPAKDVDGANTAPDVPLDKGLGKLTKNPADNFKFRTPPLRNVALTFPYTHAGGFTRLETAVRAHLDPRTALIHYDPSQLDSRLHAENNCDLAVSSGVFDNLDPVLANPIPLTEAEFADLLAFVRDGLTDPRALDQSGEVPLSVPSGLPVAD